MTATEKSKKFVSKTFQASSNSKITYLPEKIKEKTLSWIRVVKKLAKMTVLHLELTTKN